jgi:hypothetical protein
MTTFASLSAASTRRHDRVDLDTFEEDFLGTSISYAERELMRLEAMADAAEDRIAEDLLARGWDSIVSSCDEGDWSACSSDNDDESDAVLVESDVPSLPDLLEASEEISESSPAAAAVSSPLSDDFSEKSVALPPIPAPFEFGSSAVVAADEDEDDAYHVRDLLHEDERDNDELASAFDVAMRSLDEFLSHSFSFSSILLTAPSDDRCAKSASGSSTKATGKRDHGANAAARLIGVLATLVVGGQALASHVFPANPCNVDMDTFACTESMMCQRDGARFAPMFGIAVDTIFNVQTTVSVSPVSVATGCVGPGGVRMTQVNIRRRVTAVPRLRLFVGLGRVDENAIREFSAVGARASAVVDERDEHSRALSHSTHVEHVQAEGENLMNEDNMLIRLISSRLY